MAPRLSLTTLRVLQVLVEAGDEGSYGYELMKRADIASGSLYPALARLRDEGWIIGERESPPDRMKRPARTYYRLTPIGLSKAEAALGSLESAKRVRAPRPAWGI